jgi:hypothetical protein
MQVLTVLSLGSSSDGYIDRLSEKFLVLSLEEGSDVTDVTMTDREHNNKQANMDNLLWGLVRHNADTFFVNYCSEIYVI